MCLYPRLITNRKYVANKKNGGNIPPVKDRRVTVVPVGCGKCMECKKKKAREWQVRLHEEIRTNKNGKFVTLTFSDEEIIKLGNTIRKLRGYELENEIATKAVRRFLERWRKKYKKSVRHWLVTELGQNNTERIHIHGILWTNESNETISKIWKYGRITVGKRPYENGKAINNNSTGYVNDRTINYIVKYVSKQDETHKEYNSKILTSHGIGRGYDDRIDATNNKYKGKNTKEVYINRQGIKVGLPIYYRNKIYSEEEREKLWLNKLDEEVRYVDGIKIDISKGEEHYYAALNEARIKNKRLGYGDDSINWERRKYENERRNINKLEKLERKYKGVSDGLIMGGKKR